MGTYKKYLFQTKSLSRTKYQAPPSPSSPRLLVFHKPKCYKIIKSALFNVNPCHKVQYIQYSTIYCIFSIGRKNNMLSLLLKDTQHRLHRIHGLINQQNIDLMCPGAMTVLK